MAAGRELATLVARTPPPAASRAGNDAGGFSRAAQHPPRAETRQACGQTGQGRVKAARDAGSRRGTVRRRVSQLIRRVKASVTGAGMIVRILYPTLFGKRRRGGGCWSGCAKVLALSGLA